jgi:hypothetical protein
MASYNLERMRFYGGLYILNFRSILLSVNDTVGRKWNKAVLTYLMCCSNICLAGLRKGKE